MKPIKLLLLYALLLFFITNCDKKKDKNDSSTIYETDCKIMSISFETKEAEFQKRLNLMISFKGKKLSKNIEESFLFNSNIPEINSEWVHGQIKEVTINDKLYLVSLDRIFSTAAFFKICKTNELNSAQKLSKMKKPIKIISKSLDPRRTEKTVFIDADGRVEILTDHSFNTLKVGDEIK